MNTPNHLMIGNFIYQYLEREYGISLRKASFLYGCVCPDFRPKVLLKPHYVENHLHTLQQAVTQMSRRRRTRADLQNKRFSMNLGILCHYYSDFFCYAHNSNYTGTSTQHVSYERALHKYFKEHISDLRGVRLVPNDRALTSVSGIHLMISHMHTRYMHTPPTLEMDMVSSLKASMCIIYSILNASLVSEPPAHLRPRMV